MDAPDDPRCDECGSPYLARKSAMAGLCAECAHWLYGYSPCAHEMRDGRCVRCGWDGSVSTYVANIKDSRR